MESGAALYVKLQVLFNMLHFFARTKFYNTYIYIHGVADSPKQQRPQKPNNQLRKSLELRRRNATAFSKKAQSVLVNTTWLDYNTKIKIYFSANSFEQFSNRVVDSPCWAISPIPFSMLALRNKRTLIENGIFPT